MGPCKSQFVFSAPFWGDLSQIVQFLFCLIFYNFDVDDYYNFLMGKVLLGLEQWLCSSLLLSQGLCLMNVSVCRCK